MKKVLMVVLLGVFSVLFANEADNVSAKKKYYIINEDRHLEHSKSLCRRSRQLCIKVRDKMIEYDKRGITAILVEDKNGNLMMTDRLILDLSNPEDMEFYKNLRKEYKAIYDYVEE